MIELPSTSKMRDPSPRSMNSGSPPTGRNARTGLFTPPGISPTERSISLAERSMASIVLASTLSPLPSAAQAKPDDDEQSSHGQQNCAYYGPEHLSGHEATRQYADALQQPDTAHEDHQPSQDQQHVAHTIPPIPDPGLRPCTVRWLRGVRGR